MKFRRRPSTPKTIHLAAPAWLLGLALAGTAIPGLAEATELSPAQPVLLPTAMATGAATAVYGLTQPVGHTSVAAPIIGVVATVLALGKAVEFDQEGGYPQIILHRGQGSRSQIDLQEYTPEAHRADIRTTWIIAGINVAASSLLLATAPNAASRILAGVAILTPFTASALVWDRFQIAVVTPNASAPSGAPLYAHNSGPALGLGGILDF